MYGNIGGKIKGLAVALFCLGAILSILYGISMAASSEYMIFIGLLIIILGPIVAWISSWLLYGFGELIEKTCYIESATQKLSTSASSILYRFDEMIENTRDIERNTHKDADDFDANQGIVDLLNFVSNNKTVQKTSAAPINNLKAKTLYNCVNIRSTGVQRHGICAVCKASNVDLEKSEIKTEIGTRTLDICQNCYKRFYEAYNK